MNNLLSVFYAALDLIQQQISTAWAIFNISEGEKSNAAEAFPSSMQSFDIPFDQALLAEKAGEAAGICYGLVITWYALRSLNMGSDFFNISDDITTALQQTSPLELDSKQQDLLNTAVQIQTQHLRAPGRRMNETTIKWQTYTVTISEQNTTPIETQNLDKVLILAMENRGKLYGIQCQHEIKTEGHIIGVVAGQENNRPYLQCFDANFGIKFLSNPTMAAKYCKQLLETHYNEYPTIFIKEFTAKTSKNFQPLMLCLEPDEKIEDKPSNKLSHALNDRYLMAEQLLLTSLMITHHFPHLFVPVLRIIRQTARQSHHLAKQKSLDTYQAVKTIQTLTTKKAANTFEVALYVVAQT